MTKALLLLGAYAEASHMGTMSCGPRSMRMTDAYGRDTCVVCPDYTRPYYDGTSCLSD